MKISKILSLSEPPELYEKGSASMWEDDHISGQLLQMHLSQDTDAASRKKSTIQKTVDWIESHFSGSKLTILDLGCGPGLYCEMLAENGHTVTGVDYSKRSIEYAQKEAVAKNLDITYLHQNYLDLDIENKFDLAIMIFCDFDVLVPEDRTRLLQNVHRALKPGGMFIFDSLNGKGPEMMGFNVKSWEEAETGFWRDEPYLALSENFHYETEQVILQQHIVCTDIDNPSIYRFWTHYYHPESLSSLLREHGFSGIEYFDNILPADGSGMHEMVTFYRAGKEGYHAE